MANPKHFPLSFTRLGDAGGDSRCSVVWLSGEHDASTKLALASVIDLMADLDGSDVVVDLSGVTFMDASIIGTLVGARTRLARAGLSLGVRTPSACARALLALCRLDDLVWVPAEAEHP